MKVGTGGAPDVRARPAGPPAADIRGRAGGIGRSSSPEAEAVSDALRRGGGLVLDRRRRLAALNLGALASIAVVTAYQFGLLRRVPEPRFGPLDATRVDATGEAYQLFKAPDGPLALASYGATLALVGMGAAKRSEEQPWMPVLMAAKVAGDAAFGLYLTAEQVTKHRRICSWCLLAAAASVASVFQAVPEARAAVRTLRGRGGR